MSRPKSPEKNKTPEHILEANRRWQAKPGNAEKKRASTNAWRKRLKIEALQRYGGTCVCCGESRIPFLTLDHPNDDGAEHRRQLNVGRDYEIGKVPGNVFYRSLQKLGWPNDPPLRVMCFNCNMGRRCNGGICPHEETDDNASDDS